MSVCLTVWLMTVVQILHPVPLSVCAFILLLACISNTLFKLETSVCEDRLESQPGPVEVIRDAMDRELIDYYQPSCVAQFAKETPNISLGEPRPRPNHTNRCLSH